MSRLAGQHADYILRPLSLFSTRLRPHGIVMKQEVANMPPAEMRQVADYVESR